MVDMDDRDAFAAAEQLSEHIASHYDLGVTSPSLGGTGTHGVNLRKSLAQSVDSQGSADHREKVKVINSAHQSSDKLSGNSL